MRACFSLFIRLCSTCRSVAYRNGSIKDTDGWRFIRGDTNITLLAVINCSLLPVIHNNKFAVHPKSRFYHLTNKLVVPFFLPYPLVASQSAQATTFGHVVVDIFWWQTRPTKLFGRVIHRLIGPPIILRDFLVCTTFDNQNISEQSSKTRPAKRKAYGNAKATVGSARRPTTPKRGSASTVTLYLSEQQTQPTTTASAFTSFTHPKKVTGARYARSTKSHTVSTAWKAKCDVSSTAPSTEAGNKAGHVSQPSGLTTARKRRNVVDKDQSEKISALLKTNNINQELISIFETQLQKSSGNSKDLNSGPSNNPDCSTMLHNAALPKIAPARTAVGHDRQSSSKNVNGSTMSDERSGESFSNINIDDEKDLKHYRSTADKKVWNTASHLGEFEYEQKVLFKDQVKN